MTTTHVDLRTGAYADSVTLLQVSRDVAATPGVLAAQVAMATALNLEVLAEMGFDIPAATPNDMVVALRLASAEDLKAALAAVDAALTATTPSSADERREQPPRTVGTALRRAKQALALVSVPGEHAFVEAMDALDAGSDVLVFSDNVPLEQELVLKRTAEQRGLVVMGPDCGTAVVGGVGLGFANVVEPGRVGLVAASGTGCQQLICLLDHAGVGVGAALGVGGRDLSAEVGALSTRAALQRLDTDPSVEHIVLVSKPPAEQVAEQLRAYVAGLSTPVTFALLSAETPSLTAAAEQLLATLGEPVPDWPVWGTAAAGREGWLRGLFVGGTLCDEAMLVAGRTLGPIRSNIPLRPDLALDSAGATSTALAADAHLMVDFGDDALTRGRAHPMIDPTLRLERLADAAADPGTAAVLLDVVLGHGAEPDPAAALAPAIADARAARELPIVVSCIGTEADPQGLSRQAAALAEAGAEVYLSNAAATARAAALVSGGAR